MRSDTVEDARFEAATREGLRFSGCDWRSLFQHEEDWARLPYCLRIVLENCFRTRGPGRASQEEIAALSAWRPGSSPLTVPVSVSRVILPDSSGLPVLMDLAALRDALARNGSDPAAVQPQIAVDLVVDHSLIVDHHGSRDAIELNVRREFERNHERYQFFKWAQKTFRKFRVVPPGMGIVHQVHLERLAEVVHLEDGPERSAYPEFVLGGDSHTPMVNGLGVLAWGVGGVEIEAAVLGEPYMVDISRVVGVRLEGTLAVGATITDVVLTITERLRQVDVTGAFVEFFGPSYGALTVPDRATIANMAPEYGATAAFFPIDRNTLEYLHQTGRDAGHVALVEAFAKRAGLFREEDQRQEPEFDAVVVIYLSKIEPSLAGPKRPESRLPLSAAQRNFQAALGAAPRNGGYGLSAEEQQGSATLEVEDKTFTLSHGFLAIAAITACTSTSNASVMLAAGLLARNAVERGLAVPPYVKTSLAPGSLVVSHYLTETGLLRYLEELGFFIVGFGCTTCSGKSGPLLKPVETMLEKHPLIAAAVVSSNRNFEGRLHRQVRAGYLASPPLVVAFALAGRIDIDLTHEPLGFDRSGRPVFLADIWPDAQEIASLLGRSRRPEIYRQVYDRIFDGTKQWQALDAPDTIQFPWKETSTYILRPPFFDDEHILKGGILQDTIENARALGVFGDGLSTDHITPAGEIPRDSLAGQYLSSLGVAPAAFNAFTMRRGNHNVMARGVYANPRTVNQLVPDRPGGYTLKLPEGSVETVYEAAAGYRAEGTPLIVFGGRNYGMGSSRDWAAKGPYLLGVRAVIASSFERIHRSNLVALGILPLVFKDGENLESLGLSGREIFTLKNLSAGVSRGEPIGIEARNESGGHIAFQVTAALTSTAERELLVSGGIFKRVFARVSGA